MQTYPRKKVKNVRAALLWTLLLLIPGIEATLRLMRVSNPLFTEPDELVGAWHIPHSAGWYVREGEAYVTMNNYGMRDVERPLMKTPGTFRIAVLGDSYTEALQVSLGKTFCSRMQRELNESVVDRKKIEVLNFGCSGFGSTQEYLLLKHWIWQFDPDVVLLALTPGTNIRNNAMSLRHDNRPFFVWKQGQLDLDTSFRNGRTHSVPRWQWRLLANCVNHARFLQVLLAIRSSLKEQSLQGSGGSAESGGSPGEENGLDDAIFRAPHDPRWLEAWSITEKVLTLIRDDAAQHHVPFLVVVVNSGHQVNPDPAVGQDLAQRLRVEDLFYAERRLQGFLEKEGVPILALAPVFRRYAEKERVFLHGFRLKGTVGRGHWNEEGHALAGKVIADWLRSLNLFHPMEATRRLQRGRDLLGRGQEADKERLLPRGQLGPTTQVSVDGDM